MTCSGCSFEAPADFAFCPKCGGRLATAKAPPPSPTAAPDGDRRPVTVLFADLAGFTALSEGLDPEDVRAIQADLFREMSASRAIAHYREALALAEEADEPQLLFPCYDGLATVHLDLGDEGQAEEFMQKAQAVCEGAGLEPDALVVLPLLD